MTTQARSREAVSILVVDDHLENVIALQAMLSRGDYQVVTATNGTEALKHVLKHEFAVILLDVVMPIMDGFETARLIRMREASSSVPIIFLTANAAEAELVYEGYSVGAVDYLVKPLDPNIVRAKVAVFADLFKKTQRIREQEEQLRAMERLRSERALRDSEALYEATFDEAPVGIGHLGPDGRWLRVNAKLCDILRRSDVDLLRSRLQDVTHPSEAVATTMALRQMVAGEIETYRRELRCLDAAGRAVWVNLALSVLHGSSSHRAQVIAVIEDIDERKLAADRQRVLSTVSEGLLRSLDHHQTLDDAANRIVPALADWCLIGVTNVSGASDHFAGRHADADKDALVLELGRLAAKDPSSALCSVLRSGASVLSPDAARARQVLAGDAALEPLVTALGAESAMVVPLSARDQTFGTITLVSAQPGRRYGSADLAAAEDLGYRVALSIENARLYRAAQQAIGARDEFLSIASHELRTPLTPLQIMFHRLLRESSKGRLDAADGAKLRPLLVRGERQVGRLTALIDNLLDVSRISSGKVRLHHEACDLAEVVRDVVGRFGEELARAGCRAELRLGTAVPGCWDRLRLEQVVTNLLANAVKYGPGQPIEVGVEPRDDRALLFVRDHGIGIEPEFVERIFERFERAVPARSYGGLGLGLYITRQIVEAHGGTICVSSEPGRGSEFRVELPAVPDSAVLAGGSAAGVEAEETSEHGKTAIAG